MIENKRRLAPQEVYPSLTSCQNGALSFALALTWGNSMAISVAMMVRKLRAVEE